MTTGRVGDRAWMRTRLRTPSVLIAGTSAAGGLSWACGALLVGGAAPGVAVPVTAAVAAGWGALVVLVVASTAGFRLVEQGLAVRSAAAVAVIIAAFGKSSITGIMEAVGVDVSSRQVVNQWVMSGLILGEQASAVVAMLAVWMAIAAPPMPGPFDRAQRASQHHRLIPVPVRVGALWLVFSFGGMLVARWLLVDTQLLPRGVGPFHETGSSIASQLTMLGRRILAGPYEEIGYTALVGIIVFKIGATTASTRLTARRILAVVAVAGILRSFPHLYYGVGDLTSPTVLPIPDHLAAALNQVVWCAFWAGGTMIAFMKYQRIWPIAAAHSAWDLVLVNNWTLGLSAMMLFIVLPFLVAVAVHFPGHGVHRRRIAAAWRDLTRHSEMAADACAKWKERRVSAVRRSRSRYEDNPPRGTGEARDIA